MENFHLGVPGSFFRQKKISLAFSPVMVGMIVGRIGTISYRWRGEQVPRVLTHRGMPHGEEASLLPGA